MDLKEYFSQYEKAHRHPGNRFFHTLGIPMIIISLGMLLFSSYHTEGWVLFGLGWAFQFIGHALERTWPEFMKNPVFLVIGPLYFGDKILKKIKNEKPKN